MSRITPESQWQWFGNAGHFICGHWCRFHMATKVGPWLVSTVGELWPERSSREIHASIYDPKWFDKNRELKGDYFDAAYFKRFGYDTVGYGRKYETMVFKAGKPCDCGCGISQIDGSEIDFAPANTAKAARANHMKLCQKYASGKVKS